MGKIIGGTTSTNINPNTMTEGLVDEVHRLRDKIFEHDDEITRIIPDSIEDSVEKAKLDTCNWVEDIYSQKTAVISMRKSLESQISETASSLRSQIDGVGVALGDLNSEVREETGNLWSVIGMANDKISKNEEELKTQNKFIHQSLAPVICKTARGTTVAITDISPIEHTVKVKALGNTNLLMYSKNMFNPSYNGNFIEMINKIVAVHKQEYILSVSKLFGNVLMSAVLEDGSTREWLTIGMDMTNLAFKIDGNKVYSGENFETVIDFGKHIEKFSLRVSSADLMNWDNTTKIQLEYGTISTEYEPSVEHVSSFPAGVTYIKIPSVYPVTLLMSDTEGVELEVEYNVDTKKYIDESRNASGVGGVDNEALQEIKEDLEKQKKTTENLSKQVAELGEGVNSAFEGVMYVANNMSPAIRNTTSGTSVELTDVSSFPHTLNIKVRRKNLFDGVLYPVIYQDANFKESATSEVFRSLKLYLVKGTYTLSFGVNVNIVRIFINGYDSGSVINKTSYTFTVDSDRYVGFSFRRNDETAWLEDTTIQLEEGSIVTPYTPYVSDISTVKVTVSGGDLEPEICAVNTDGTVEGATVDGIASRYPTTTITPDTEGIILDVEYNVDTKKYIDNKFAELQALILEG